MTTSGPMIGDDRDVDAATQRAPATASTRRSPCARRSARARSSAPRTYGVVPDAAMPTTKSPRADAVRVESLARRPRACPRRLPARADQRGKSAGDDALHHLRIAAERRRAFGRVEHAEAARRSGADVEQPPAATEGVLGERDRLARSARAASRRRRRPLRSSAFMRSTISSEDGEIDLRGARVAVLGDARIGRLTSHDEVALE